MGRSTITLSPADVQELERRAAERRQITLSNDNLAGQHRYIDSTMQDWRRNAAPRACKKCRVQFVPMNPMERNCSNCRVKRTANKIPSDVGTVRTYSMPHANGPLTGPVQQAASDCPSRSAYVDALWARLKGGAR